MPDYTMLYHWRSNLSSNIGNALTSVKHSWVVLLQQELMAVVEPADAQGIVQNDILPSHLFGLLSPVGIFGGTSLYTVWGVVTWGSRMCLKFLNSVKLTLRLHVPMESMESMERVHKTVRSILDTTSWVADRCGHSNRTVLDHRCHHTNLTSQTKCSILTHAKWAFLPVISRAHRWS